MCIFMIQLDFITCTFNNYISWVKHEKGREWSQIIWARSLFVSVRYQIYVLVVRDSRMRLHIWVLRVQAELLTHLFLFVLVCIKKLITTYINFNNICFPSVFFYYNLQRLKILTKHNWESKLHVIIIYNYRKYMHIHLPNEIF